jgi:hypothetical protein
MSTSSSPDQIRSEVPAMACSLLTSLALVQLHGCSSLAILPPEAMKLVDYVDEELHRLRVSKLVLDTAILVNSFPDTSRPSCRNH